MLTTALDAVICVKNGVGSQSGGITYDETYEKYFGKDVTTSLLGTKPNT